MVCKGFHLKTLDKVYLAKAFFSSMRSMKISGESSDSNGLPPGKLTYPLVI